MRFSIQRRFATTVVTSVFLSAIPCAPQLPAWAQGGDPLPTPEPGGPARAIAPQARLTGVHTSGIVGLEWSPSEVDTFFSLDLDGQLVKSKYDGARRSTSMVWKVDVVNITSMDQGTLALSISP